jgi:hypothetical protein
MDYQRKLLPETNCLFQSLSLPLDDEGQHNRLRQKVVQYVYNNLEQFLPFFPVNGKKHLINIREDCKVYMGKNGLYGDKKNTKIRLTNTATQL